MASGVAHAVEWFGTVPGRSGSAAAAALAKGCMFAIEKLQGALAASLFVAAVVAQNPAVAQQPAAAPPAGATKSASANPQQELEQLLAPIALYPDALIAQILMASTYPLEVVEAARWTKENPSVKDKALEDAMQKQTWDESVKALTSVPQVLKQMNENLSWTQKLGDAFLADQAAVLAIRICAIRASG